MRTWLIAALTLAVAIAACRTKPGPEVQLDILLIAPDDTQLADVCAGADAYLLHISDKLETHTFVLDSSRQLAGADEIGTAFPSPTKIALEGISITPSEYSSGSTPFVVVCRGVVDANIGPLDQSQDPDVVSTTIRMLRVGAVNGLFNSSQPQGFEGAISPVSFDEVRTTSGGGIVYAGGSFAVFGVVAINSVYFFDPRDVRFYEIAPLNTGRKGATAAPFVVGGAPAVVIAGGSTDGDTELADAEIVTLGPAGASTKFSLQKNRFAPTMLALTQFAPGGSAPQEALVLAGGCDGAVVDTSLEAIVATAIPAHACTNASNALLSCMLTKPGAFDDLAGHCRASSAVFPDRRSGIIGGGYGGPAGSGRYLYEVGADLVPKLGQIPADFADPAAVTAPEGGGSVVGALIGGDDGVGVRAEIYSVNEGSGASITSEPGLTLARAFHAAVTLPDGRVLVIGGSSSPPTAGLVAMSSLELGRIGSAFELASIPDAATPCEDAPSSCAALPSGRIMPRAAVIRGSATWLNGAVVIAGGTDSDASGGLLYVPAWQCEPNGELPADLPIDYCDVGRAR